ncbi:MAG: 16S rRNA (uracil(1498)-N(3))-methyltransferase [Candidatus Riflebacteria bacterium HGW-Riflebacteria-1]|jgi:16S rRNA (uracil1498-N3)-methyltransferase|nr:MAG: 16S rRNA (uracil(1498)-N(3))-methyltransferase [Candidatus Riflebacteria bacterium HGW-Riflebacteria-1]
MVPHARVIEVSLAGTLSADNRHRLERVLRLREGDEFVITDGCGHEATAVLGLKGNYQAGEWQMPDREPLLAVSLFAAVSKGERFEWLIEKAVEMGVARIVPLMAERCIVKEPGSPKVERWRKIAATAMLQCGGCLLPEVADPVKLELLPAPAEGITSILLHEEALSVSLYQLPDKVGRTGIWLVSGPEGGFSDREVKLLLDKGWQPVWLGRRLFKTDTAPTIALANLLARSWFG